MRRWLFVIIIVLLMVACKGQDVKEAEVIKAEQNTPKPSSVIDEKPQPKTPDSDTIVTFTIGATGDIMVHNAQLTDGKRTANDLDLDVRYSFDHWFDQISDELNHADILIGNFETNLAGYAKGYTGYPEFNSPIDIAYALKNAGFDVLTTANNHAMDMDYSGMVKTLEKLDQIGIAHTGTFSDIDDYNDLLYFDVKGAKICIISASYLQPEGALNKFTKAQDEYAVNLLEDTERVTAKIKRAKAEGADVVALSLHWGKEMERQPNEEQREYAQIYIGAGADVIFGHHPHVTQPVEWVGAVAEDGTLRSGLVYWSLGNFISNQSRNFTNCGIIGYTTFGYNQTKDTVEIVGAQYVPLYVYKARNPGHQYQIIPASYYTKSDDANYPFIKGSLKDKMAASYLDTITTLGKYIATPVLDIMDE
jgi:hypothetical protein